MPPFFSAVHVALHPLSNSGCAWANAGLRLVHTSGWRGDVRTMRLSCAFTTSAPFSCRDSGQGCTHATGEAGIVPLVIFVRGSVCWMGLIQVNGADVQTPATACFDQCFCEWALRESEILSVALKSHNLLKDNCQLPGLKKGHQLSFNKVDDFNGYI